MFFQKYQLTMSLLMLACLLGAFLQPSEGRPRTRHHRGDSRCRRCEPGWGVEAGCTESRDTKCGKCIKGTYSPHHNMQPCWVCSRCGPGLYEAHPCTDRGDTVCDSCHRAPGNASENFDFRRKCKGLNFFLAPEDAESTGEQRISVNKPQESFYMEGREMILQDVEAAIGNRDDFDETERT